MRKGTVQAPYRMATNRSIIHPNTRPINKGEGIPASTHIIHDLISSDDAAASSKGRQVRTTPDPPYQRCGPSAACKKFYLGTRS